jgi:hypothetical protein
MSIAKINPRPLVLGLIILAIGIFRVLTSNMHGTFSGFTPLGAMALFAGFYFQDKLKAYFFPLLTLWLSDIILNRFLYFGNWVFFYENWILVYASFAFMVWLGQILRKVTMKNIVVASALSATTHWLVTDFGVWLYGCTGSSGDIIYSPDLNGLFSCYYMALPSLANFFIGNLFFSALLFGAFEFMQKRYSSLQLKTT